MNGKSHTIRRTLQALALTASVAAVAVPTASAGNQNGAGLVPSKLGSPDPRESVGTVFSPGLVASKLGSQDPRDTAAESESGASMVARRLGSQDPRDTASQQIAESSIVVRQLGTPDTRDAATQPDWLRAPQIRGEGMNEPSADGNVNPVGTVDETSSGDGFDFGSIGIGIVVAVCGLLLLTALGIGARQVRHTRHGLGSA